MVEMVGYHKKESQKVKIAIDLRPLQSGHKFRGIGKYIANVVPELFKIGAKDTFVCYYYGEEAPDLPYSANVELISGGDYNPDKLASKLARKFLMYQPGLKEDTQCDVLFQPDISFGLSKKSPTVVTLYDLIPIIYRDKYFVARKKPAILKPFWDLRNNQVFQQFMRINERFAKADGIVSISQASIHDLHKLFANTSLVPYTITPLAAQALPKPSVKRIHNNPFMIYVGGTDSRKNLHQLVDMFTRAVEQGLDMDLLLIGYDFTQTNFYDTRKLLEHIEESSAKSHIKIIGYADDQKLATYYAQAKALLFSSEYEGFGMPILEAMQAGCPVVCFNNSSIPEVAGKAAIMADNKTDFINGIKRLANSEKLRQELIRKGHKQASMFTWETTARKTYDAFKKAANK